jgi:hypothetical protein
MNRTPCKTYLLFCHFEKHSTKYFPHLHRIKKKKIGRRWEENVSTYGNETSSNSFHYNIICIFCMLAFGAISMELEGEWHVASITNGMNNFNNFYRELISDWLLNWIFWVEIEMEEGWSYKGGNATSTTT